jgi:hypothetical protein
VSLGAEWEVAAHATLQAQQRHHRPALLAAVALRLRQRYDYDCCAVPLTAAVAAILSGSGEVPLTLSNLLFCRLEVQIIETYEHTIKQIKLTRPSQRIQFLNLHTVLCKTGDELSVLGFHRNKARVWLSINQSTGMHRNFVTHKTKKKSKHPDSYERFIWYTKG